MIRGSAHRDAPGRTMLAWPLRCLSAPWCLALAALGAPAALAQGVAEAGSGSMAWLGWLGAGGAALVAGAAGMLRQRRTGALWEARTQLQQLGELLDVWQWRTDAEHRLTQLRPPADAPATDWSEPHAGRLLWEVLRPSAAATAALRAQFEARVPLGPLPALRNSAQGERGGRLRGVACVDAQGRFTGYLGTWREDPPAAGERVPVQDSPSRPPPMPASDAESFSYTISHDLRAPIRVVEGFTRIVKEDYGRVLDRVGNDHLDRVLGAAQRMNAMIDALLALSQLSATPLASEPVDLSALAAAIVDELRRQEPAREVRVHIEPGLQAHGDPTLLRMALENLLGNAWKYSARSPLAQIWFERSTDPVHASFVVRDNGAGFDMRFADRLFAVFQRLHSASDFPGTGIGLASVRRIVQRHGGDIWAESEPGRGASFYFTLPRGIRGNA